MRFITKNFLAAGCLLLGLQTVAQAGPILVLTNGALTSAVGVEYKGQQYDVTFSDIRPTADNLMFNSLAAAYGASDALDRLVFQGIYDFYPSLTEGCTSSLKCLVVTAYYDSWLGVSGAAFTNTSTQYLDSIIPYLVVGDAANQSTVTYAHWTVHEVRQAVPEPSTLLLTGGGMALLLMRRRRGDKAAK